MATELEELYERDFYLWTRRQAKALRELARTRPNLPVDWKHLVEEVEDLGRSELHAVQSQLETVIEHLLKLAHSPAAEPRAGWAVTVRRARRALARKLTPSLRRRLARDFERHWQVAREDARFALTLHGEAEAASRLPERCPWSFEQLLDPDFFPEAEGR